MIRMPFAIVKHADKSYSVINTETHKVHALHTTKEKAKRQMRLLYGVMHGFEPTGQPAQK
jgi:hypothetical protein